MTTREQWLTKAVSALNTQVFDDQMPKAWSVTCGQYFGKNANILGTCVDAEVSTNGTTSIFISPALQDPMDVLGTLVHEMIHAVVGVQEKHGGKFKKMAIELEMSMPAKSTLPVPDTVLWTRLERLSAELGPYPHAALNPIEKPKRVSALMTFVSPEDPEYTVSASMEKVIRLGFPVDPWGNQMVAKDQDRFDEFIKLQEEA